MGSLYLIMHLLLPTLIGVLAFIILGFVLSRLMKRNDIADFLWGLGFIAIALINAYAADTLTFRGKTVLILISFWGLRLTTHLAFRIFGKRTEDPRYKQMRETWGKSEPLMAFLKVFVLQGVMLGLISLSLVWALRMPDMPLSYWDFLGAVTVIFGIIFEGTADAQLVQFKKNPENRGKVMKDGLWAFSRHPNYFGEAMTWWGFFFISLQLQFGMWTLISPLVITFLLTKVTGVPLLEKGMASKGTDFKNYALRTPRFFPFHRRDFFSFLTIAFGLCVLDFIWVNLIMGNFYRAQGVAVMRMVNGNLDVLPWGAVGVYFWIAFGIQFFAVRPNKVESVFRGAIFGLCAYSIYDFTNIALVRDWPLKMAMADIIWGTILCGSVAILGSAPRVTLEK